MNWKTGVMLALEEFATHKLRTFLTMLGMIFGVGAVIAMLSIGEGAEREALSLIDSMGLRNILVESKENSEDRLKEIREKSLGLTLHDLNAIHETMPQIVNHTTIKQVNTYTIFSDGGNSHAEVLGVSPSHFEMTNTRLREGRPLLPVDDLNFAQVCVIGGAVARELFPGRSAIGGRIKVNHLWLTVVGVMTDRALEQAEFEGVAIAGVHNQILVPIRTALKKFKFKPLEDELDEIHVQVEEGVSVRESAATLVGLLETRHRGVEDYTIIVPEALLEQNRQTRRIFNIVMACIAGISLLVGGIGIMNIMLANVLERTWEIGIRRAIGAKQKDIRMQFIIESFTISVMGGLLGVVLGFGIAQAISIYSGWAVAWSLFAVVLSVGVCAGVGLIFGIYPAVKAARLDPIEALRRD